MITYVSDAQKSNKQDNVALRCGAVARFVHTLRRRALYNFGDAAVHLRVDASLDIRRAGGCLFSQCRKQQLMSSPRMFCYRLHAAAVHSRDPLLHVAHLS